MKTGMLSDKQYDKLTDRLSKKYLNKKYKTKWGDIVEVKQLFISRRSDERYNDKCIDDKGIVLLLSDLKRKVK